MTTMFMSRSARSCLFSPLGSLYAQYCGVRYTSSAVQRMTEIIQDELKSIEEAGTWKPERVITTKQGASIAVKGETRSILNFCSNNYLGLSVST